MAHRDLFKPNGSRILSLSEDGLLLPEGPLYVQGDGPDRAEGRLYVKNRYIGPQLGSNFEAMANIGSHFMYLVFNQIGGISDAIWGPIYV